MLSWWLLGCNVVPNDSNGIVSILTLCSLTDLTVAWHLNVVVINTTDCKDIIRSAHW